METNRLLQFRIVVETGNLRKAASLLNMSHSGLSKSMKALEAELGFPLFLPSGRGIVISDEGQALYERSMRFFEELDRLIGKKAGAPARTSAPLLRIGSFETFTSFFIGPLLKNYLPEFEAEVHDLVPGRLEDALLYHKIDVGITSEPVPRKGIDYVKVATISMDAFALKGKFADMEIGEVPFVVPVTPLEGSPSVAKGRDSWPDDKIPRNLRYRVDTLSTALEIARQGLAAIFIPLIVAREHNRRVSADCKLESLRLPRTLTNVKREVYVVKRESRGEDKVIRQIARALRDLCSED